MVQKQQRKKCFPKGTFGKLQVCHKHADGQEGPAEPGKASLLCRRAAGFVKPAWVWARKHKSTSDHRN